MRPLPKYIDDQGVVHVCAPAWSCYAFACKRLDVHGITQVDLDTPLSCMWCVAGTAQRYEDPIADVLLLPVARR